MKGFPAHATRRQFLRNGGMVTTAALLAPSHTWGLGTFLNAPTRYSAGHPESEPDFKALAERALGAATAAGASYADVRFTRTYRQQLGNSNQQGPSAGFRGRESEFLTAGVRVLVQGTWGFASHTELTPEFMEWMGRSAVTVGRANRWPHVPSVDLGERTSSTGSWHMPVGRDPFLVENGEKEELMNRFRTAVQQAGGQLQLQANFERQERTLISTEGAFTRQTVYCAFGRQQGSSGFDAFSGFGIQMQRNNRSGRYKSSAASPVGKGFEALESLMAEVPQVAEHAAAVATAVRFETPGRYPVVFDASTVASLISVMGQALDIDRALGYEMMADGGSFLSPPDKILGTTHLPASITITADRTMPGGAATVQWDDEGVPAQAFPLISNGIVVDYATSREFVPEMAAWYREHAQSVRSRGCAISESASFMPVVQTPNLTLHPASSNRSFEDLLQEIDNGYAVLGCDITMDQQLLTGFGDPEVLYAVRKGKLAGAVTNAIFQFSIPELWKGIISLGGAQTTARKGFSIRKGQPDQLVHYTVQAVAALFKDVIIRRHL